MRSPQASGGAVARWRGDLVARRLGGCLGLGARHPEFQFFPIVLLVIMKRQRTSGSEMILSGLILEDTHAAIADWGIRQRAAAERT